MKKFLSFSLLFFFSVVSANLFAQKNSKIDSLMNVLKTAKEDSNKVNTLNALSSQFINAGDYEKAIQYADSVLALASALNFKRGNGEAYYTLGLVNGTIGNYDEALKNYKASLKLFRDMGDKRNISMLCSNIGIIFNTKGNYLEAIRFYNETLGIATQSGNKKQMASTHLNIGTAYFNLGNYPDALNNYYQSLKVSSEIADKKVISKSYENIGAIFHTQKDYAGALKNYSLALSISKETGLKEYIASNKLNIGLVYDDMQNYSDALKNYFVALDLYKELDWKSDIAFTHNNIGWVYLHQNKFEESLNEFKKALQISEEIKDVPGIGNANDNIASNLLQHAAHLNEAEAKIKYREASVYANKALSIIKETGEKLVIRDIYKSLSVIDSALGNFPAALEHFKLHALYKDSILNEETSKQTSQLKIQYETEKKDKEIALLNNDKELKEEQIEKQKLLRNGLIIGSLLLIIAGVFIFRTIQLRRKLEKQQAVAQERKRISADLHDDVGSTLSSIRIMSTVAENNPQQSAEMVKKISENSKRMLENMGDIVWTENPDHDSFTEMLARMNQYASQALESKGIRFNIVTGGVSENIQLASEHRRNFYLIFKEAVNNVAKYSDCTEANIVISRNGKLISMKIMDNGKGFAQENGTAGNGLKNMRRRAATIHGELKISSSAGKGTTVELQMPVT